jgi:hypothetical protein
MDVSVSYHYVFQLQQPQHPAVLHQQSADTTTTACNSKDDDVASDNFLITITNSASGAYSCWICGMPFASLQELQQHTVAPALPLLSVYPNEEPK